MIRPNLAWRMAVVLATASLALTACGNSDSDNDKGDGGSSKERGQVGDGTLTIGTLLPQTGDLAVLGPPEIAGVSWPSRRSTPPVASTARRSPSGPTPATARLTSPAPRSTGCSPRTPT